MKIIFGHSLCTKIFLLQKKNKNMVIKFGARFMKKLLGVFPFLKIFFEQKENDSN